MGLWKSFVKPTYNKVKGAVHDVVDTVTSHPLEAAALAAGGYYFMPEISAWISADGATAVAGDAAGITDLGGGIKIAADGSIINSTTGAAIGKSLADYATPLAIAGSSLLGANAAQKAASTQAQATAQSNALISKMYEEQKALQKPYVEGGTTAQNRMLTLLGLPGGDAASPDYGSANKNFTPSDLTTDPSYQFRLNEGLKSLDRQAAARGGLISGGAIKAAQEYGQQSASQEYQNAFNRFQTNRSNMLQPLGNLITSGQNAAAGAGTAAANYGNTVSNNIQSGAAAKAAGDVGTANAIAGGVSQYLNYNQGNNLAELLLKQRQSAYGVKA